MGSVTPVIKIARGVDHRQVNETILSDPRWELARRLGLKDVKLRVDPDNPEVGQLYTRWESAGAAASFLKQVERPFDFEIDGERVVEPVEEPRVFVNATVVEEALQQIRSAQ